MKIRVLLTLFFIIAVAASSVRCAPQVDIRAEAFIALEQMHKSGLQHIDEEIAKFDQEILDLDNRATKLEQLMPQVEKWIEEKKSGEYDVPCG